MAAAKRIKARSRALPHLLERDMAKPSSIGGHRPDSAVRSRDVGADQGLAKVASFDFDQGGLSQEA
ncbi:MAG: hypothetical protein ACLQJL_03295 [Roseiarcus sp.]